MTGVVMLASAACVLLLVLAVWVASVVVRDASIIDIFWGAGFVVIAWVSCAVGHGNDARRVGIAVLVTLWGLRLAAHIGRRNLGHGEDLHATRQCARARARRFWLTSLYRVYLVQAVAMWIVSLPVQAAASTGAHLGLGPWDAVGAAVWLVGLLFEAIGDRQLDRFRQRPRQRREGP